jgi:hypothetical protein
MYYEGFNSGDIIEISETYRCQIHPMLNSMIRSLNNPGEWYANNVQEPVKGIVLSETLNGIWAMVDYPEYGDIGKKTGKFYTKREFLEKDKYLFKKLLPDHIESMLKELL